MHSETMFSVPGCGNCTNTYVFDASGGESGQAVYRRSHRNVYVLLSEGLFLRFHVLSVTG